MENKKDLTVEELQQQCEEAKKNFETLNKQLKKAQQDEEDRRKAKLALEKENRKNELEEAFNKYMSLLKAYIKDYGSYHTTYPDNLDLLFDKAWKSFF